MSVIKESTVQLPITCERIGVYSDGNLPRKVSIASWSHYFCIFTSYEMENNTFSSL